ncbi:MAG: hypothetical protein V4570_08095 [Pseudomonadota bacterium]
MSQLIVTSVAIMLLCLTACDKPAPDNLPDQPVIPLPQSSGDEGIDEGTRTDKENSGDEEIQIEPRQPNGDSPIIIPPPEVDMPPDIVPEKPYN